MKQVNRRKSNKRLLTSIYGKDPAELSNSQKSAEALTLNSILNYRPKKKKKRMLRAGRASYGRLPGKGQ